MKLDTEFEGLKLLIRNKEMVILEKDNYAQHISTHTYKSGQKLCNSFLITRLQILKHGMYIHKQLINMYMSCKSEL